MAQFGYGKSPDSLVAFALNNSHLSYNSYLAIATAMKRISAKDAKNGFGRLLDTARVEPVTVEKHGRGVVVVLSVEEYQRLKELDEKVTSSDVAKLGGN